MFVTRYIPAIAVVALFALPTSGTAQDGNRLFIKQDSSAGGAGNTLFVDQSGASGSTIGGTLDDIGGQPTAQGSAVQTGPAGNEADIVITGSGGQVALRQDSSGNWLGGGNSATIDIGGLNAAGLLTQKGRDNFGELSVSGNNAFGSLEQIGRKNDGTVSVSGNYASGTLVQNGNNNTTGLNVVGPGSNVTWTMVGNNTTAPAPTVTTNGGTVIVTQIQN